MEEIKGILQKIDSGELSPEDGQRELKRAWEEIKPTAAEAVTLVKELGIEKETTEFLITNLAKEGRITELLELQYKLDEEIKRRKEILRQQEELIKTRIELLPRKSKTATVRKPPVFMPVTKTEPPPKSRQIPPAILPIKPDAAIKSIDDHFPSFSNEALHQLRTINTKDSPPDYRGTEAKISRGDYTFILKNYELVGDLDHSGQKLLTYILWHITTRNRSMNDHQLTRNVTFSIKQYLIDQRKPITKPNTDFHREQIIKDLSVIESISVQWTASKRRRGQRTPDYDRFQIIERQTIDNGLVKVTFTPTFIKYCLMHNLITFYPSKILELDAKNKPAFLVAMKLTEHYRIPANHITGTNDIISIKTLLNEVQDVMTNYETVRTTTRDYKRRLINPMIKALDRLQDTGIIKYQICGPRKAELTPEEINLVKNDYFAFKDAYIKFEIIDTPDQSEAIEKAAERLVKIQEEKQKLIIKRQAQKAVKAKKVYGNYRRRTM